MAFNHELARQELSTQYSQHCLCAAGSGWVRMLNTFPKDAPNALPALLQAATKDNRSSWISSLCEAAMCIRDVHFLCRYGVVMAGDP